MDAKPWYQSKGVWGSAIAIIAGVAGPMFGLHLDAGMQGDFADWLASVGVLVGGALALYGRIKAGGLR